MVIEKIATLHELENYWSINDVMKVFEILELKSEWTKEKINKLKKEKGKRGNS